VSDDARFCNACGAALDLSCTVCGTPNGPSAKFCERCGTALGHGDAPDTVNHHAGPTAAVVAASRDQDAALEGARKSVTVLFADVAGFTSMSERLDAEDAADIMRPCFDLMQKTVHRYGGTVSQFIGDGIMALFGAPLAQEDHAERGVLAALSIQKALRGFREELMARSGIDVRMRIGLNSGRVVVDMIGTDLNPTYTAIGDAVNLASRVEGLAPVGSVAVSEHTDRLVTGAFETRDMGLQTVKGKDKPVRVYEVLRPMGQTTRYPDSSSLIGRQQQLSTMLARYDDVLAGHGQLLVLSGTAGIGKSRLTDEFAVRCPGNPALMTGRCLSYGSVTPYLPLIDLVRGVVGLVEADGEATVIAALEAHAASLGADVDDSLTWIRFLLAVDPGDEAVSRVGAAIRKLRVFEALRSFLFAHTKEKPVIVVIEDLHWIDDVSQEFISFFLQSIENERVTVVLTHRPEYHPLIGASPNQTAISLTQLAGRESEALAAELLEASGLSEDLTEAVSARTGGNPLFTEEVVRSLRQTGTSEAHDDWASTIPATLHGLIAARLDRLDTTAISVIRTAAFIGAEFSTDVLAAACDGDAPIDDALATLEDAELVAERSLFPDVTYAFRHALVRDVVVDSLLKPRRRIIHLAVARALETVRADRQLEFVETPAHHFTEAQVWPEAANYLVQSGRKALAASSPQAEDFFSRALDVVKTEPDALSAEQVVATYRGAGRATQASGEFDRSVESFTAMLHAAQEAGDRRGEGQALLGLVDACMWAHRFEEAQEWAEIVRKAAIDAESDVMLAGSRFYTAFMSSLTGDLAAARIAAADAIDASQRPAGAPLRQVAAMIQGSLLHWEGKELDALEHVDRMVELGRRPEGMELLAQALFTKGMIACAAGDYVSAFTALREGVDLATRMNDGPRLLRCQNTLGGRITTLATSTKRLRRTASPSN
jgi:class 3 adenylate cyclase/tetratricopeptide (TPR) repeat protein